eukprot:1047366-Alexandrium_andersonii.AAC.1
MAAKRGPIANERSPLGGMPAPASARPNYAQISYAPRDTRAKRWECSLWASVHLSFFFCSLRAAWHAVAGMAERCEGLA